MSTLVNIPILKAGNHPSRNKGMLSITEQNLMSILEGSNACKGIIKESINTGTYRGNEIELSRPIPGALNLHHDDILDETIKERVKDIDWEFGTEEINGETWLTQTFRDVPEDIAKSIKKHFPRRSVELMPLTHPDTGIQYPMVIRTTAFLDKNTLPAVSGQSHDIQVEFAGGKESPITVLYSAIFETSSTTEGKPMDEKNTQKPDEGNEVAELESKLSAQDTLIAELQAQVEQGGQQSAKIAELQAARKEDSDRIAELQAAQDTAEVTQIVNHLKIDRFAGENGIEFQASPAFIELAAPIVKGTRRTDVIELAAGEQPARDVFAGVLNGILELAAKGGAVVPMGKVAEMAHADPDDKPESLTDQAKKLAKADDISYAKALLRVKGGK